MSAPVVLNAKDDPKRSLHLLDEGAVYVGRPSKWGNPFKIGKDGNRDEVISMFRDFGRATKLRQQAKAELRGKNLVCWCAPEPCHADVLLEWANE
jgi:hypothetical protein